MNDYNITVQTTVPVSRVADLVCCALEGGSTYWCGGFKPTRYPPGIEWGHEAVAHGAPFVIRIPDDGDRPVRVSNSKSRISGALQLMANKFPKAWADFINENEDANTGDLFFQLVCFGAEVYG